MRAKERERWMALLSEEREAHRKERQELMNRIAQPQTPRVDSPSEPREPNHKSKEDIALAFVGQELPPGVDLDSALESDE